MQFNRPRTHLFTVAIVALISTSVIAQTVPGFTNVLNFRDIGGYRTADGHHIRHHVVYRSGQLSYLNAAERGRLAQLGIAYEINLLSDNDAAKWPTPWGQNPPIILRPFFYPPPQPASKAQPQAKPKNAAEQLAQMQRGYAILPIYQAAGEAQIMRLLAQAKGPALIHCHSGKDRTGVTIALLMTLLGVPRTEIYHEFLLSNEGVAARVREERAQRKMSGQPDPEAPGVLEVRSGVEASLMDKLFEGIDAKYHSFDAYTRDGLKLSSADIQALRARLLE